jgi:hypothetical protein
MNKIKEIKLKAWEYLNDIPYSLWAQHAFPAPRFGHITSNIAESINSAWDEYRCLPILRLFTSTWTKVMSTIHSRRQNQQQSNRITDFARNQLQKSYQQARRYQVKSAKDGLAQAFVPDGHSYVVNLQEMDCSCGEFQEFLIPCRHAVAVCLWQVDDPYDYVHEWYSLEYYRATYSRYMHPIREEDLNEEYSESEAPILTKQHGRSKKRRYQHGEKTGRRRQCGHCGQDGHNRRSCRNAVK